MTGRQWIFYGLRPRPIACGRRQGLWQLILSINCWHSDGIRTPIFQSDGGAVLPAPPFSGGPSRGRTGLWWGTQVAMMRSGRCLLIQAINRRHDDGGRRHRRRCCDHHVLHQQLPSRSVLNNLHRKRVPLRILMFVRSGGRCWGADIMRTTVITT